MIPRSPPVFCSFFFGSTPDRYIVTINYTNTIRNIERYNPNIFDRMIAMWVTAATIRIQRSYRAYCTRRNTKDEGKKGQAFVPSL